ncbi:DUF5058 family protein [Schnuerera sp. xch1]|uniref:DUF5058 family protein n=1 Tax=Schnuerera sp. xch1 TaxID=2874283 RepID=UPI001CBEB492|nr:DUF5058 family protein [Schnuerera sp. xch1]MBZ2175493.1 DUF5058 family protein [Schnuerera sp. xch1]
MKEYLQVANQPMMWLMVLPAIIVVLAQVFFIAKRAFATAEEVEMTKEESRKAFRIGFVSGIGPALSVFIVMVAMIAVLGGPITWLRTVIIGAASTELTAATFGAEAMGVEFGSPEYGITEYANSILAMVLNGSGWLIICGLFTDKLGVIQDKIAGGNTALYGIIGSAAITAAFSFLLSDHLRAGGGSALTAVISGLTMVVIMRICKKYPKLEELSLGIAMVIGMAVSAIVFPQ